MMMSSEALHIGGFILPWSLLSILLAWLAVFLWGIYLSRKNQCSENVWQHYKDSLWSAVLIGLIAARVVFVLIHADAYFSHPIDIIKIQDKGFSPYAGMVTAAVWFIWKNRALKYKMLGSSLLVFVAVQLASLALLKPFQVQAEYPALGFHDLQQQPQALTQFIGQATVINLWASWCPPCHREMPVLYQAQQDYPDIHFVMINQGEATDVIKNYLSQHQFNFKNVLADPNGEMAQQMKMYGMPSTLFFNAQGQLVEQHMGELSPAMLKQYLQKMTQLHEVSSQ
ncbi:TlpA disulfide reductase family protein [Acinetobacter sp. Ac_5812]|uniref:TlpA disulfide reductase family protein n=1 Tax=Acinetobacter sp. Ac_5812 TaxID=1848937 RepID=UPI0014905EE8|nr:TlpA disulfide reductase family protein [Acinetobacter sp. Ac_5812]NNP70168.1 redoxin [Acinetobacter sp. Ac_5812]